MGPNYTDMFEDNLKLQQVTPKYSFHASLDTKTNLQIRLKGPINRILMMKTKKKIFVPHRDPISVI
jgi:hypothetical protein